MTAVSNNIHCSTANSSTKKPIVYFDNKTNSGRALMMIMPFEFKHERDGHQAAADMIVQNDVDSFEAGEDKHSRATVTMIPAYKFNMEFLRDVVEQTEYKLTNQTDFAIRLFMYLNSEDGIEDAECFPFFGTIEYNEGTWKYLPGIVNKGTLAYEYAKVIANDEDKVN
jgi:hypothetical protein